jgi:hypothetical protein
MGLLETFEKNKKTIFTVFLTIGLVGLVYFAYPAWKIESLNPTIEKTPDGISIQKCPNGYVLQNSFCYLDNYCLARDTGIHTPIPTKDDMYPVAMLIAAVLPSLFFATQSEKQKIAKERPLIDVWADIPQDVKDSQHLPPLGQISFGSEFNSLLKTSVFGTYNFKWVWNREIRRASFDMLDDWRSRHTRSPMGGWINTPTTDASAKSQLVGAGDSMPAKIASELDKMGFKKEDITRKRVEEELGKKEMQKDEDNEDNGSD